jgi:hypothetical protein
VDEFVALASGVRIEEAKPLASIPFIVTSFNKDKQGIRSRFADTAYSAATTPEEKLASYKDFILNTYNSQNKMSTVLEDAKTLGVDTGKLRGLLEQRLTKTETQNLLSKKFKIPTYSEEAFSSVIKRLENTDPLQAAKISEQNKVVQSIFRDIQRKLFNFPLGAPIDILDGYIEQLLTPGVEQSRELIRDRISPSSPEPVNVQPRTELPSQITGTTVNAQILTSPQVQQFASTNLGQRYNLLPTSAEKLEFLNRIV